MSNQKDGSGFKRLFDQLDQSQCDAVFHSHGPALIVAGPGSGKTATILGRVWYLISQCHVMPDQIIVLTFTKAAANSLQSRFISLAEDEYFPVSFGTFHSFFYQILRQYGSYKDSKIISTKEKMILLNELGITDIHMRKEILCAMGYYMNHSVDDKENILQGSCSRKTIENVLQKYLKRLEEERMLDFDHIAELTLNLLKKNTTALLQLQRQYRYILVDEFQDTNPIQYECLKLLTQNTNQIFVVGDDDQAIYSFRGSFPSIMSHMNEDYASLRTYYLARNYRCGEKIVKVSERMISANKHRLVKQFQAYSGEIGEVKCLAFQNTAREYSYVVNRIKELSGSYAWTNMAVISRTNRQLEELEGYLEKYKIPFDMRKQKTVKESVLIKEVIGLAEHVLGRTDKSLLWRNIAKDIEKPPSFWRDKHACLFVNYLCKQTYFAQYMKERMISDTWEKDMEYLQTESRKFKTIEAFTEYLKVGKTETMNHENGIKLLTMHGAKGLEFGCVILIDINEGIIPGKGSKTEEQIEEERRMLYVGMTRAKKILDICYLTGNKEHPRFVSRFLNPILGFEKDD